MKFIATIFILGFLATVSSNPFRKDSKRVVIDNSGFDQQVADLVTDASDNFGLQDPPRSCYPTWPNHFEWSYKGPIARKACLQIEEPLDPDTWRDNYLCYPTGYGWLNPGFKWSHQGPIDGMTCTQIKEPSDRNGWDDNYLCVPSNSRYQLRWSYAGRLDGYCIQWIEPSDKDTWQDNYLCQPFKSDFGYGC